MITLKFKAYGKINPYLYVGKKRDDGFHEVVTVMQKATVYDTVTLAETEKKGIRITSDDLTLPNGNGNLVYLAVEKLHEAIGRPIETLKTGYNIHIEKRIPVAGGMGGGSADAGYTLKHLNKALGSPLTKEELRGIATSIGSDVPFFVYDGDAMLATGRGEILNECHRMPQCRMEFVSCGKKPSTGAMFAALDRNRESSELPTDEPSVNGILKALEKGDLREICRNFHNSFEEVFTAQGEEYRENFKKISDDLRLRGAIGVLLCGSGPTVCGIFEN